MPPGTAWSSCPVWRATLIVASLGLRPRPIHVRLAGARAAVPYELRSPGPQCLVPELDHARGVGVPGELGRPGEAGRHQPRPRLVVLDRGAQRGGEGVGLVGWDEERGVAGD